MNRQLLIDNLSLLAPALSAEPFIQLLTHFWFDDEAVTAYNDRIAIQVTYKTAFKGTKPGFRGCVPGNVLLGLIRSSTAEEITLTQEEGWLLLKTKVMNAKLATLDIEKARDVFTMPETKGTPLNVPTSVLVPALQRCLRSTTKDTGAPEHLGVTLIPNDAGTISLYSTDNHTMTRCVLVGELKKRCILSTEFCKQVVSLLNENHKKPVDLRITDKHAILTTKDVTLYGKLVLSEKPIDFDGQYNRVFPVKTAKSLVKIPSFFSAAIERSLIVAGAGEGEPRMTIECKAERFRCSTKAVVGGKDITGTVHDAIDLKHPDVKASCNPLHIKSAMEFYNRMVVTDRAIIMTDDNGSAFLVATTTE